MQHKGGIVSTRVVSVAALLVASISFAAAAQSRPPLTPGARIRGRFRTTPQSVVGVLDTISGDTVQVRPDGERGARVVTLTAIKAIDVSRGQRSNALKGAQVGLVAGGGVGLVAFVASCKKGFAGLPDCRDVWLFAPIAGGLLVGTVIGSRSHSEKWESVPLSSLRVAPISSERLGVTFSIAF